MTAEISSFWSMLSFEILLRWQYMFHLAVRYTGMELRNKNEGDKNI